jgi:hypothetical protein
LAHRGKLKLDGFGVNQDRVIDNLILSILALFGLVTLSTIAGGVFGLLALVGMGLTMFGGFAVAIGCAVGLLPSPVLVWALWVPPRSLGLVITMLPTAAVSYGTGMITGGNGDGNPIACALVSLLAYAGFGLAFGHWARKRRRLDPAALPRCPDCRYSLHGMPPDSKCPQCGRQC